jgi:AmiR/NasT family two-component response regulator
MSNGATQSAQVSQAQGMVSVQAECSMPEALTMLRERAMLMGQTLDQIAVAVVERRIRFGEFR